MAFLSFQPRTAPLVQRARAAGVPVMGEVELAYWTTEARFAAVTGSNGKSTTTALLGALLRAAGIPCTVAGNIGVPLCGVVPDLPADHWVVAEISSFQLETTVAFRPAVGVLLNLAPNHLDRHADLEEYYGTKARLFAAQESPTAAEMARDINKFSNNVMARQLFLTLSAEALKLPGRYERSARAVHAWLESRGLVFPELVIENGSGLSRIDRISAAHMGRLLVAAFASPVMPELMASLPLVAQDGTMKRRLQAQGVAGQAHVKSGSLSDARTLAGYVLDRNGRRLVVVFFVNDANAGASQPAHDAVLKWAYEAALRG